VEIYPSTNVHAMDTRIAAGLPAMRRRGMKARVLNIVLYNMWRVTRQLSPVGGEETCTFRRKRESQTPKRHMVRGRWFCPYSSKSAAFVVSRHVED